MSSIWSNAASGASASPFATTGAAPKPGGMTVARMQRAAGETQPGASPRASAKANATSAADSSADASTVDSSGALITANDFLSLLVTEMQNQDPTADTDPNEYVDQLVQINSLEQLISINQNLAEVLGTATSPVTGTGGVTNHAPSARNSPQAAARPDATAGAHRHGAQAAKQDVTGTASPGRGQAAGHGNVSLPSTSASSRVVAHALDGRVKGAGNGHGIRDIPTH